MDNVIEVLKKSVICTGMTEEEMRFLLKDCNSTVGTFQKGDFVFREKDKPNYVLVLLSGKIVIAKDTPAGKRMILARVEAAGELFGEVYAFMELPHYDMYAQAAEETKVLLLCSTLFYEMGNNEVLKKMQNNLLKVFAMKAYFLNRKVRVIGSASIREKIVRLLIERQDENGNLENEMTREEMADYLNVTRPSLSRELSNMVKEGILAIEGRSLLVRNQTALEEYL